MAMTENSKRAFNYAKEHAGEKFTIKQVQDELGIKGVAGCYTAQVKKGNMEKFEETVTDENGKAVTKKLYTITEQGMSFDPDAE